MTGSLPSAMPTAPVQSQPLSPITSQPLAPLSSPVSQPRLTRPSPVAAGPVSSPASRTASAGWTAAGGTPVVVAPGEGLTTIANRYGVPASAILSANGLSGASQVTPGRSIVIPVYNAAGGQAVASIAPTPPPMSPRVTEAPRPSAPARSVAQTVKPPVAKLEFKPEIKAETRVSAKPPAKPVAAPVADPVPPKVAEKPKVAATPVAPVEAKPQKVASIAPSAPAPVVQAPPVAAAPAAVAKEPVQTASLPSEPSLDFRWPARGRVIAGFGTSGNEGINISVPEGTPVKAAEGGTVAYAGSELKGYGNLVLIRHDNGYVSAYAHNDEITVKRGDKVRRGQVVAKSGRTGNVNAPQLHFEIRKGSNPVDPMPYLSN